MEPGNPEVAVGAVPAGSRDAQRWLPLLHDVADRADEIALSYFRSQRLRVDEKGDGSPVSEADRAIEAEARRAIASRAPGLGVLGEEEGESAVGSEARLIIDPIDGTRNFVRGIPIFAALLAVEALKTPEKSRKAGHLVLPIDLVVRASTRAAQQETQRKSAVRRRDAQRTD